MTGDAIASYIEQGLVPPQSLTYTVSATTLVLNPSSDQVGLSGRTVFTASSY
jgi:hypothetical protein